MSRFLKSIFVPLLLALTACSTVDGTGRRQLNFMPLSTEMAMGLEAYTEVLTNEKIVKSGADADMVQRIGKRVAEAAIELYPRYSTKFDWEFVLIDDPNMVNAWALPGGKCAVYSGLLPVTGDEDSLAIVVGHEVAHAISRHGGERMSQNILLSGAMLGTSVYIRDRPKEQQAAILGALGLGSQVGIMLPFSRSHESEADEIGLYLAATAGYDPRTAIPLWERMGASGGAKPPEWLSTHPAETTRIRRLKRDMPKALEMYQAAGGKL
jgi:predicted Zn-dependent protease